MPTGGARSRHLESRREVEDALASHGVPVTAVRAGLVVGRGGSALAILTSLVRRLPLMVTPAWTRTPTHPIALPDLLRALEAAVVDPRWQGQTLDVGGPEVLTYREMMQRTAAVLGVRLRDGNRHLPRTLGITDEVGEAVVDVAVPVDAILAVYARENGQGMVFTREGSDPDEGGKTPVGEEGDDQPRGPHLRVIK